MTPETATAAKPTISAGRAPRITRARRSRPRWSVPSTCTRPDGPRDPGGLRRLLMSCSIGSQGLSHGAPSEAANTSATTTRPNSAVRRRGGRRADGNHPPPAADPPAGVVGAEHMHAARRATRPGRLEAVADVLLDRVPGAEPRGPERGGEHERDDDETEQRRPPAGEPSDERQPLAPCREPLGGDRERRGGHGYGNECREAGALGRWPETRRGEAPVRLPPFIPQSANAAALIADGCGGRGRCRACPRRGSRARRWSRAGTPPPGPRDNRGCRSPAPTGARHPATRRSSR